MTGVSFKRKKGAEFDTLIFKRNNSLIIYKIDPSIKDITKYRNKAVEEFKKK